MAEKSSQTPHVSTGNAALQDLAVRALRYYGDQSAESADAATILMFVDFANEIIEEVRQHPYWSGSLDYYTSQTSKVDIPDIIITRGLAAKYAAQQGSDRTNIFVREYYQTLNRVLWNRKNGNQPIEMKVVDGGSNTNNGVSQNELTGDQYRSLANNGQ